MQLSSLLNSVKARFIYYLGIWIGYLIFMAKQSNLGIDWLPFQEQRVWNAVNNILTNKDLTGLGITSWTTTSEAMDKVIYAVQSHEYLHYVLLLKVGGINLYSLIAPHIDKVILFFLCLATSEVCLKILSSRSLIPTNILGVWSFLIISTVPFTYRMLLALWQDVYFLTFFLLSSLLFFNGKKNFALATLVYAFFWQYHWGYIYGIIYVIIRICSSLATSPNNWYLLFPPGYRKKTSSLIFISACFLSPLFSSAQSLLIKLRGYKLLNSDMLIRIGVSNPGNIHHGGILGALQFLGGNRYTLCLDKIKLDELNIKDILSQQIFSYNCILSITSFLIISIIAILSYTFIMKISIINRWFLIPLATAFFSFVLIFQQALSSHTQGHSIIFAPIFTIGIVSLSVLVPWFNRKNPITIILFSVIICSIVINSIRVSYLTGLNG